MKNEKKKRTSILRILFYVFLVFIFLGVIFGPKEEESTNQNEQHTQIENNINSTPEIEKITDNEEKNEDDENKSNLTIGQENALETANSYLRYSAFSYDGLIDQLEYEGYSTEDATFAATNCSADWNEQALKSANSYLEYTAFSYDGLIEQLEYEGFTNEQANYGVENCGADWNEQAAKSAKSYLDFSSFSRDGLINQLEYEGFSYDQAVYGVEQNGY